MQRSFDPHDPLLSATILVASVSDQSTAQAAARAYEREAEDSHDFREIRAIMGQRHGICG